MSSSLIKIVPAAEFNDAQQPPVDAATLSAAAEIVEAVRSNGETAIRKYTQQFSERTADQPLSIPAEDLAAAFERIPTADQDLLKRVADRIESFAKAQMKSLSELTVPVPGGSAGHTIEPIRRAGCYAPGGRYPLPSSVLMTAVTARAAGCESVVVASPNPTDVTLAAAHVAGAEAVLPFGGAHAIAAMAYGFPQCEKRDLIAGPGNRWVTAAKQLVVGSVGIDMLAGPSELAIVADDDSDPETTAADLLAQAEHDTDARPFLICFSTAFADRVAGALEKRLSDLPTAETARIALGNGAIVVVDSIDEALSFCDTLAPEHLELHLADAEQFSKRVNHAGCIFIGSNSAEVFGDYGAGPNHTLPTGGTARWSAGLNVFTFLRVRTWLQIESAPRELVEDTMRLAEHEGLIGHSRAAERRTPGS